MSASADSIVFNADNADNIEPLHQQCGELSPRSTGSYSSRDSRERFIRPTPERAMKILQRLIHDKMHDVYEIPEVFDKHIRTVIEKFCVVSLEAQGTLEGAFRGQHSCLHAGHGRKPPSEYYEIKAEWRHETTAAIYYETKADDLL